MIILIFRYDNVQQLKATVILLKTFIMGDEHSFLSSRKQYTKQYMKFCACKNNMRGLILLKCFVHLACVLLSVYITNICNWRMENKHFYKQNLFHNICCIISLCHLEYPAICLCACKEYIRSSHNETSCLYIQQQKIFFTYPSHFLISKRFVYLRIQV